MKQSILLFLIMISAVSFAETKISAACLEQASYEIINYLEEQEPRADVHLVKNAQGELIGLTDAAEIYGSYDLVSTESQVNNQVTVLYQNGSHIVFAEVLVPDSKFALTCKVLSVDSGQDDQD